MTQEVLHSKIDNIENQNYGFNKKQIVTICLCLITATASVVTAFWKYDGGKKEDNLALMRSISQLSSQVKENRLTDSLHYILLNQKLESDFDMLNLKIRYKPIAYHAPRSQPAQTQLFTERKLNGKLVFVPMH